MHIAFDMSHSSSSSSSSARPNPSSLCAQCALLPVPTTLDELIRQNLPEDIHHHEGSFCQGYLFQFSEIEIRIAGFDSIRSRSRTAPDYHINTRLLARKLWYSLDERLRATVHEYAESHTHAGSLRVFEFAVLVLRMVEEAAAHLPKYNPEVDLKAHHEEHEEHGYNPHDASWYQIRSNKTGVNLAMVPNTAQEILGLSPQEICEDILPEYRIVHVESVMRSDLCRRYLERQEEMRKQLMRLQLSHLLPHLPSEVRRGLREKEEAVDYLIKPKVTFHGTSPHHIPSIVQCGFLKPGDIHPLTEIPLPVRCGSTYGRGIYSSPDPSFSLAYSGWECVETGPKAIPGLKLIICATIMGRTALMHRDDNWREQSKPYYGADSHVANDNKEYIVFHNSQILPCYVVHLDWREMDAHAFVQEQMRRTTKRVHPRLNQDELYPGDRQRLKEQRVAQAMKYFAYGFGPVSGKNIVIEEIGEIDDDEEDYGEYQENRVDNATKVDIWSQWQLKGETSLDEYSHARKAKTKAVSREL